jgi:curved DNA-binding protein CbpA
MKIVIAIFLLLIAAADRNYYSILGVPRNANDKQIKQAYRKLTLELHPDKNKGDPKAAEKFKEVNTGNA